MTKQHSLFEKPIPEGYPVIMQGTWKGKYRAFALANTPERRAELEDENYTVTDYKEIPIPSERTN